MVLKLDTQNIFQRLQLPRQDIEMLPFCGSNKASKVIEWTNSLKVTQSLGTCNQLYQAIPQVLRLQASAIERKQMLDALFAVAYPAAFGLGKDFLNQPLALPQQAQKMAVLGQAILNSLVSGYFLCLKNLLDDKKVKLDQRGLLGEIFFNALQCLALMQLRNAQLYSQASPLLWRQANSLYQLALHADEADKPVKSHYSGLQNASPKEIYLRLIALASARLNQLTQIDMGNVFSALESWSKAIKAPSATPSFWIDLNDDAAPTSQQKQPAPEGDSIFTVDFNVLTQQIASLLEGESNIIQTGYEISIPAELSSPSAIHLEQAWSKNVSRESHRQSSNQTAEVVVGFGLCHSKLSGIDNFADFIGHSKEKKKSDVGMPFLSNMLGALTPSDNRKLDTETNMHTSLRMTTQNISKEGYCFKWEGQQPVRIDAGDVICVREHAKRGWGLGIIRWIRKFKHHSLLGVQLLSNKPTAIAAACNFDDGGYSDFMRAFLLPSSHPHQGPTLLTAHILFKEGAKIKLKHDAASGFVLGRIANTQVTTSRVKTFTLQIQSDEKTTQDAHQHQL